MRGNKKSLLLYGVIALFISLSFLCKSFITEKNAFSIDKSMPRYGVESLDRQDIPAQAEKEPVYISVFKFIINCNPFKAKRAQ